MKPFFWEDLDPSEVWPYVDPDDEREEETEPPGLPMTLGPSSNSPGSAPPSPFDITAPGFSEMGLAMVRSLNWGTE